MPNNFCCAIRTPSVRLLNTIILYNLDLGRLSCHLALLLRLLAGSFFKVTEEISRSTIHETIIKNFGSLCYPLGGVVFFSCNSHGYVYAHKNWNGEYPLNRLLPAYKSPEKSVSCYYAWFLTLVQ